MKNNYESRCSIFKDNVSNITKNITVKTDISNLNSIDIEKRFECISHNNDVKMYNSYGKELPINTKCMINISKSFIDKIIFLPSLSIKSSNRSVIFVNIGTNGKLRASYNSKKNSEFVNLIVQSALCLVLDKLNNIIKTKKKAVFSIVFNNQSFINPNGYIQVYIQNKCNSNTKDMDYNRIIVSVD